MLSEELVDEEDLLAQELVEEDDLQAEAEAEKLLAEELAMD